MIQNIRTQLLEKGNLVNDAWRFRFKLVEPESLDFITGQYLITKIPPEMIHKSLPENVRFFRRHFSIASPASQKEFFELVIQMVNGGVASTYYRNLNIGDEVLFDGPAGVFTLQSPDRDKIFLATGTGIAPIRSILHTYLNSNVPVGQAYGAGAAQMSNQIQSSKLYLFWGLRSADEVYFFDELKNLAEKNPNFKFKICLSRQEDFGNLHGDFFAKGRVNLQLAEFLTHAFEQNKQSESETMKQYINRFEYYLCGDRIIVESLRQFLLGLGVDNSNIIFEKF